MQVSAIPAVASTFAAAAATTQASSTRLDLHRRVLQAQPLLLLLPLQQAGHRKGALPRQLLPIQLQQLVALLDASRLCRRAADQAQHPHTLATGGAARLAAPGQVQALRVGVRARSRHRLVQQLQGGICLT